MFLQFFVDFPINHKNIRVFCVFFSNFYLYSPFYPLSLFFFYYLVIIFIYLSFANEIREAKRSVENSLLFCIFRSRAP